MALLLPGTPLPPFTCTPQPCHPSPPAQAAPIQHAHHCVAAVQHRLHIKLQGIHELLDGFGSKALHPVQPQPNGCAWLGRSRVSGRCEHKVIPPITGPRPTTPPGRPSAAKQGVQHARSHLRVWQAPRPIARLLWPPRRATPPPPRHPCAPPCRLLAGERVLFTFRPFSSQDSDVDSSPTRHPSSPQLSRGSTIVTRIYGGMVYGWKEVRPTLQALGSEQVAAVHRHLQAILIVPRPAALKPAGVAHFDPLGAGLSRQHPCARTQGGGEGRGVWAGGKGRGRVAAGVHYKVDGAESCAMLCSNLEGARMQRQRRGKGGPAQRSGPRIC